MVQLGIGQLRGMVILAVVGVVAIALALGPSTSLLEASASSATFVDEASLDEGQLKVEGETVPGASITIFDFNLVLIVVDTADDSGRFRIEVDNVESPTCIDRDDHVGVSISRGPNEILVQKFVHLDPCDHLGLPGRGF